MDVRRETTADAHGSGSRHHRPPTTFRCTLHNSVVTCEQPNNFHSNAKTPSSATLAEGRNTLSTAVAWGTASHLELRICQLHVVAVLAIVHLLERDVCRIQQICKEYDPGTARQPEKPWAASQRRHIKLKKPALTNTSIRVAGSGFTTRRCQPNRPQTHID